MMEKIRGTRKIYKEGKCHEKVLMPRRESFFREARGLETQTLSLGEGQRKRLKG